MSQISQHVSVGGGGGHESELLLGDRGWQRARQLAREFSAQTIEHLRIIEPSLDLFDKTGLMHG